jgi:subtilisin-like proprotein convertase family protein
MKIFLPWLLLVVPLTAATTSVNQTFSVSTTIPDNNIIGVASTRSVNTPIKQITNIRVSLSLTGGWNGDFYAYLSHGSGFSILLNRAGRSVASSAGAGSSGMSVTFGDDAASDVHTALPNSGLPTGFFQPDARATDPANTLDTDSRSAFLSSFAGLDPNGEWTLFIADVSPGDTSVFQSWSLEIQGVPEPASGLLAMVGAGLLFKRRR